MLYHACITSSSGKIDRIVLENVDRDTAIAYLKKHHNSAWLKCEAIPQPIDHPHFKSV